MRIFWIPLLVASLLLAACGGSRPPAELEDSRLYAALPSGALMLYSASPQEIAGNPLFDQLRGALGWADEPVMFTAIARQAGLDPTRQLMRMDLAIYHYEAGQSTWGMVARGPFEEEAVVARLQSGSASQANPQLETKSYLGQDYYVLRRISQEGRQEIFVRFIGARTLLAANQEGIMQKSIVVARGKESLGISGDENLQPVLEDVATDAPMWFAGLARGTLDQMMLQMATSMRGESLGRGMTSFRGELHLSPEAITFRAVMNAENAEAASNQVERFDAIKISQTRALISQLGRAAVDGANQIEIGAEDSTVVVSLELTAEETAELARQVAEARATGQRVQQMLQEQLLGQQAATAPAAATQPVE